MDKLQKAGIPRTSIADIKNLNSVKTARSSDVAQSFDAGLQTATDGLTSFNKILNNIANTAAGKALLGYGGGALGGLQSLTDPSHLAGSAASGAAMFGGSAVTRAITRALGGGAKAGAGAAAGGEGAGAAEGAGASGFAGLLAKAGLTAPSADVLGVGAVGAGAASVGTLAGMYAWGKQNTIGSHGDKKGHHTAAGVSSDLLTESVNPFAQLRLAKDIPGVDRAGHDVGNWGKDVGKHLQDAWSWWDKNGAASGMTLPGYAPGKDTEHTVLSKGEGVIIPEAVVGIGGPKAIDAINQKFMG
jgi:hypothetical protein